MEFMSIKYDVKSVIKAVPSINSKSRQDVQSEPSGKCIEQ